MAHTRSAVVDLFVWSVWRAADEGKIPAFTVDLFSRSSHTTDLKLGTSAATLPGAWCYRVSAGTGWSGVNIL